MGDRREFGLWWSWLCDRREFGLWWSWLVVELAVGVILPEGGDWEYVKNVPVLHSEASHSLPPQLIDTNFAKVKMKANISCTRMCLCPSK